MEGRRREQRKEGGRELRSRSRRPRGSCALAAWHVRGTGADKIAGKNSAVPHPAAGAWATISGSESTFAASPLPSFAPLPPDTSPALTHARPSVAHTTTMATQGEVKEQVVDRIPKRITELQFGIL